VVGLKGVAFSVRQLAEAGVRRISVGSSLSRAALGAFTRAAREIRESGTFTFADAAVSFADANAFMPARPR
jgi:2-methylisocitrate lyase-like PEP mutase family enzyme